MNKTKALIKSQYYATLAMLKEAITNCPDAMWADLEYKNQFWLLAYHALFYTHLYLGETESNFVPWEKHKESYHSMEPVSENREVFSREALLEYFELVWQLVAEKVDAIDLEGDSGFSWLPFGKLEVQLYNIRHLQHHTGELCERLGTQANIDIDWVGMKP